MIQGNAFGRNTLFPYVAIGLIIVMVWSSTKGPKSPDQDG